MIINVMDYGAKKDSTGDSTVAVQQALEAARLAGEDVILDFPKGEYHFYKDFAAARVVHTSNTDSCKYPTKYIAFLIENQENLTVNGNGSVFVMHGNMMALAVIKSRNIVLREFSWDFPCATTVEVKMLEKAGRYADYAIPSTFQWEIEGKNIIWHEVSPFDGKEYWKFRNQEGMWAIVEYDPKTKNSCRTSGKNGPLHGVRRIEKTGENTIRVHYWRKKKYFHPGNTFEMCQNGKRETAGAFIWESENVAVQDIGVHYMCGFGFLTQMSADVTFSACRFVPRAGSERRTTSFADLIHVSGAKGKVTIENCQFSDAHDDPINIHGTFTRVHSRVDDHTLVLQYVHSQQGGFPQYHPGDRVVFYARDTLIGLENEKEFTVKSVVDPGEDGLSEKLTRVTFEEPLPAVITDTIKNEKKYVAENVTYTPEVVVRGCKFITIPTRGILCTTRSKVLIEDNEFYGMSMASIFLSNDSNDWYESGPIRDMTIRRNTFYIIKSVQTEWSQKGAILIHPVVKGDVLPAWENPIHKNITIEDNEFYMEHDKAVEAESVENLIIRNNAVKRYCLTEMEDAVTAFRFTACKNVVLENNTGDKTVNMKPVILKMPEAQVKTDP